MSMTLRTETLKKYMSDVFVETGTFDGRGVKLALESGFKRVISIELDPGRFKAAKEILKDLPVELHEGDSSDILPAILEKLDEKATIFLDAHPIGGGDICKFGRQKWPLTEELTAEVRGRDLVTGLPQTVEVTTEQIREALEEPVAAIVDAVKATLDKTPPELAADIMEGGITITGGGALLMGLDVRLEQETGMPINIAPNPLHSVVIGSGQALEEFDSLRGVLFRGQES
jgi:hypothetical protein